MIGGEGRGGEGEGSIGALGLKYQDRGQGCENVNGGICLVVNVVRGSGGCRGLERCEGQRHARVKAVCRTKVLNEEVERCEVEV